ncbi:FK506-binding protein [Trichophyton mentagrophytes]|nr:FK506-binding protein [Trichophyton mentagrophytes]
MSGTQPVALYAAKVPPGALVPAVPDAAAMFRVTMAAIDPDAVPEYEDEAQASKAPRATLKIIRPPPGLDYDDDDDDNEDDEDEDDDESDDETNGGPSDPARKKKAMLDAALKDMDDGMEEDDDDDEEGGTDLAAAISKLVKGKGKAMDDEDDSDSDEDLELDEVVVCTLDPERNCQQTLDFVVGEGERVFFKVTGTHTVYVTGNYVTPLENMYDSEDEDDEEDEEDDYDLSPDEDELAALVGDDDESDELDDMANPRVMEIDTDEEEEVKAQTQAKQSKKEKKGKKRPADDSDEEPNLDDMISKTLKDEPATNGEAKLSKKQMKKLKKNNGEAAEAEAAKANTKSDKKVQFAKDLEQGPTPSKTAQTGTLGVKQVQGVTVDDKKLGTGKQVKKGDRIGMRYIGKLENGKVFDSNKSGKPFTFKVGTGEVIKGWDIGIPGMAVGGERRLTIPAHLAYGKQSMPGIPANSKLIFDVKLLNIK